MTNQVDELSKRMDQDHERSTQGIRCVVKWFNDSKGFGFVALSPNASAEHRKLYGTLDFFMHYSAIKIEGFKTVVEGKEYICSIMETPKGPQVTRCQELPRE